ncbi:MAG: iron ABC transporter permease, partial [Chloroflexi bacterium]|nr:iron ABC transporter permease [Chloroflexota bacterium]
MAVGFSRLAIGRIGRVNHARPPVVVWLSATLIAIAVLLPLVYLALRASGAGAELWSLLFRPRTLEILGRTVILVIAVTGISLAISLPLAWLTQRTDLPLRRMWSVLTVLPLVIPSYVVGFVIVAALGPRGILQQALAVPFGLERLPEIYGFPGALLAVTLVAYPYALLTLQASMHGLDPRLEEVARSLGHGRWDTFRRVVFPQLRPAMAASALLVALYTLRDFGAVSLLRYETFTWAIYLQYQTSFDRILAAGLSLVLVVIAVALLFLEFRTRGKSQYHRSAASVSRSPAYIRLGNWRWPALCFCSLVVLLALVMPVSILSYWAARGFSPGETLGVTAGYALNSAYVAVLAAVVTAAAAISIAVLDVRFPSLFSRLLERITYIGFALPGIVVALALVFFSANYATPIYQTLLLLVFAYAVLFLPQAVGSVRSSLLQLNPRLEDAARSLGRTPLQTLTAITLPLVRPGILAGVGLVFL